MKVSLRTLLQLLAGIGLSAVLLYLTFQDRSFSSLTDAMKQADMFWFFWCGVAQFLILMLRSFRWQMLLRSAGYPSRTGTTLLSTFICYMVNSLTPKLGEVVRCTVLLRTDKVPISASLGTVVSERVIDLLVLLGGLGVIFLTEFARFGNLFTPVFEKFTLQTALIAGVVIAVLIVGAWLFFRYSPRLSGIMGKIAHFIRQTLDAARSVFRMRRAWLFLTYTFLIWVISIVMNYFFLKALPETVGLGMYFAYLLLFLGGIGWAFPVPGGIGPTNFIILQVFLAYGLTREAGQNIGLLTSGGTFVFMVGFGIIAWFILLGRLARKQVA